MKRTILITILLVASVQSQFAFAQDSSQPLAIRAGTIWTVSGDVINDGVILVTKGKIQSVGKDSAIPDNAVVLELPQSHVMPGMIDAHSQLALFGDEKAEMDETVLAATPDTDILDTYDPLSQDIVKVRSSGVTTAFIAPGNKNPIAGRTAVVKLIPNSSGPWLLKKDAGLKLSVTNETLQRDRRPTSRPGMISFIKEQLDKGKQHNAKTFDLQAVILKRLVERKMPAFITAGTPDEITAALTITRDYKLNTRLVASRRADELAEQIAKQKIPVIYTPMLSVSKDKDLLRPGKLSAAGVKIAFASHYPLSDLADVRLSAILATRYGMDPQQALKSLTLHAAEILGVANRIGSIQKGKDADLVILSGDPLEITSAVQAVIINGNIVYQREKK